MRTAIALLRHRTVNGTAAAEGVAPSSVSDRIRRLEGELGAPLFNRDRTGMRPTRAGRVYLDEASNALGLLDRAGERLRAGSCLVVAAQSSVADKLLPAVLRELTHATPDLDVQIRPEPDRLELLRALDHGDVDAVVLLDAGPHVGDLGFAAPNSATKYLDVREVRMATIAGPRSQLVGRPVTIDEVRRTGNLVGREERCSFWMATRRWLGPDVALSAVGGLAQVREWVADGKGVAVLPEFAIEGDVATGRVCVIDTPTPPLQLRLLWRAERDAHAQLRRLLYALSRV